MACGSSLSRRIASRSIRLGLDAQGQLAPSSFVAGKDTIGRKSHSADLVNGELLGNSMVGRGCVVASHLVPVVAIAGERFSSLQVA